MARKARTIATWTLSVLLTLLFLMSGSGKLLNSETSGGVRFDEQFEIWGYPSWFRFPVGLGEVAGAIALLIPPARPYAAAGLTAVMLGAVLTHLRIEDYGVAPIPLVLAGLAGTLGWLSRPAWVDQRLAGRRAQVTG